MLSPMRKTLFSHRRSVYDTQNFKHYFHCNYRNHHHNRNTLSSANTRLSATRQRNPYVAFKVTETGGFFSDSGNEARWLLPQNFYERWSVAVTGNHCHHKHGGKTTQFVAVLLVMAATSNQNVVSLLAPYTSFYRYYSFCHFPFTCLGIC